MRGKNDTISSRKEAQLMPITFNKVHLEDSFWKPRLKTQAETLVPFALDKTIPAVENLEKAAKFLDIRGKTYKPEVGNVFFNYRMFLQTKDAQFIDVAEISLFNNSLAGVNIEGNPIKSDEAIETVELIPMGAARLRISAFPVIGDNIDAKKW